MRWHIALAAAMLIGGARQAFAQSERTVPASRVAAALEDVQQRQAAEPSTRPTTEPAEPQAMRDEIIRLRGQINSLQKENSNLHDQLQQANNDRYDMQKKVDMALELAQRAYLMSQRSYSVPTYAGWTDSWAYPGGPVFTVPAQGAVAPPFLPPIPGNGTDPRFLPRNFALPNVAPGSAPTRGR